MSAAADATDPFSPLVEIEAALSRAGTSLGAPAALADAMRYSLLEGGKRLRPLLCWHCCVASGGRPADALAACVGLEMVHAFSLVHDDLPALDNDDLRRGRPTLHKHAGEGLAILAGDGLLIEAVRAILHGAPSVVRATLVKELTNAASDMVRGQVFDTLPHTHEPTTPDAEKVRTTHRLKTGSLIAASCRMGAICAFPALDIERRRRALRACGGYGRRVGLMFQIVDDLLDIEQSAEHAGKRTGKDAGAGKLTYPAVLGVQGSRSEIARLLAGAEKSLAPLGEGARSLQALAEYMARRTK